MIGIIVSGSAVPTAARTEPTAPSASSSLRPNHSMPLVNSSAPSRMTRNASASTSRSTGRPTASSERWRRRRTTRPPRGRQRDQGQARSPAHGERTSSPMTRAMGVAMRSTIPAHRKPSGSEGEHIGEDRARRSNGGNVADTGSMPLVDHQHHADREQADRRRWYPTSRSRAMTCSTSWAWSARCDGGSSSSDAQRPACHLRTPSRPARRRTGLGGPGRRCGAATRAPTLAPTKTPRAVGPAMYGSSPPRSR